MNNHMPVWCKRCREPLDGFRDVRLCRRCGRQGCYHCTLDGECESCIESDAASSIQPKETGGAGAPRETPP